MEQKMNAFPSYEELVALVNKILDDAGGEKLTLRQIYYKLVVLRAFENNINNYKRLSERLVKARERGHVDDSRIEDRAREIVGGDCSLRDPDEFYMDRENSFRDSWSDYSRPFWLDQKYYVEVFIEKNTLIRIVSSVANRYHVTTCVGRGYSSYSYVNEAVKRIIRNCQQFSPDPEYDRSPVILYLGDHDPSGVDMVRDLEYRLRKYGLNVPEDYPIVRKIGVTREQIEKYDLPTDPLTLSKRKNDKRSKKFIEEHGVQVVELDVFDNEQLKSIVKAGIEEYIDPTPWNHHLEESNREREEIKKRIEAHFGGS